MQVNRRQHGTAAHRRSAAAWTQQRLKRTLQPQAPRCLLLPRRDTQRLDATLKLAQSSSLPAFATSVATAKAAFQREWQSCNATLRMPPGKTNATTLSTGRYPWAITVNNGGTPTNYSGNVDIVNQANSPYGVGWSLDNVEQLVSVSGGMMLVNPDGTSMYFANNGSGAAIPAAAKSP